MNASRTLLFTSAFLVPVSAATVNVAIGDGGLSTSVGGGFTSASNNGLSAENGDMWGLTSGGGNNYGLIYDSYSSLAGGTLPATIQVGTYTFEARVGNNGVGGNGFSGLNDLTVAGNASLGLVAGFFVTAEADAQDTKNNMYFEWNSLASVSYSQPTGGNPAEDTWTTWTFTWEIDSGSPVIGTNPNFGVYTKTGGGGGNGFWDDSTMTFTAVPEPSTSLIGALFGLGLLRRRRRAVA